MTANAWELADTHDLSQGELLRACPIPLIADIEPDAAAGSLCDVRVTHRDVIVVTQSCDLAARGHTPPKADLVAATYALSSLHRWRLRSPFLEHFSQAFALFFMRVGLPFGIPKYT